MNKLKAILLILVCCSAKVNAQDIITDRPDQTESSSTIPKGSLQIESGMLLMFSDENGENIRQVAAPSTLFRYGIAKWLEIRLFNQFESVKNITTLDRVIGISDIELGFKAQLFRKETVNFEMAFLSHLILPTGSDDISNNRFGTINKLSIGHTLSKKIGLGYNLGYNNYGIGKGDFTYSLVIGISVTDKVGIYLEPFGELVEFNEIIADFDAGLTYLLKPHFQLDFSFGTGLNHRMNYISAGFSWNIDKKEEK